MSLTLIFATKQQACVLLHERGTVLAVIVDSQTVANRPMGFPDVDEVAVIVDSQTVAYYSR